MFPFSFPPELITNASLNSGRLFLILIAVFTIRGVIFRLASPWLTNTNPASTSLVRNMINMGVFLIGGLMILQTLGISITPIITALGVGGLSFALAMKDTLTSAIAGLQLLLAKQIRPGDYIRLEKGDEGVVKDVNWRTTTIRTPDHNALIVPNDQLVLSAIKNYSFPTKEHLMIIPFESPISVDPEKQAASIRAKVVARLAETHPALDTTTVRIRWTSSALEKFGGEMLIHLPSIQDRFGVRHEMITALGQVLGKKL
jgi:small-conductance mechanosensitive channel